ncbi:unnamed protein product, partial [Mesorhabditis belari]|uniref:Uncharacterized protein n=1 Tax=Mesorhabditis belari TaxID=2138241 RepID=A0AAF3FDV4_9BILA
MEKIEEGLTNAITGKLNDLPSKESEPGEHALERAEHEFEMDPASNKERIEDEKTVRFHHKEPQEPGSRLNEQ